MKSPRILIIDDMPLNSELIKAALALRGLTGHSVASVQAAEAFIEAGAPDIVITDVNLPGTSGLTLARRLKADVTLRSIVVIAVSANPGSESEALAAGCDAFLTKPIRVRTFAETIQKIAAEASRPATRDDRL